MKKKLKVILVVAIAIAIVSISTILAVSLHNPWVYLGPLNYQLIMGGNAPIVFNAMQEIDARHVTEARSGIMNESGVEIIPEGKNVDITLEEIRGKIIPELKFYGITKDNKLVELSKEDTFEVPFTSESNWSENKFKIIRLRFGDEVILSGAEPEFSSTIPSPDHTKYLLANLRGMWLIPADSNDIVKISADTYMGKTYDELSSELKAYWRSKGSDGPATLFWNDYPLFSPDSSKVVYITNKDCTNGGNSIWIYDFLTNTESPLIKSTEGEYYNYDGWLDGTHLIVRRYVQNKKSYLIVDTNGAIVPLNLEGDDPGISSVSDKGIIVYRPNYSKSQEIIAAKIHQDGISTELYRKIIDGGIRLSEANLISPDGTKIAYLFVPSTDETKQNLAIAYLESGKETVIEKAPKPGKIYDFAWLDNDRLLVYTRVVENGLSEISSWIYNVERK